MTPTAAPRHLPQIHKNPGEAKTGMGTFAVNTLTALQMTLLLPAILNLSQKDISVAIKLYVGIAPLDLF